MKHASIVNLFLKILRTTVEHGPTDAFVEVSLLT